MEIATPKYSHIEKFENVYEPAEDTFLLMDSLEKEQLFLQQLRPCLTVEVGCGSGVITAFLSKILDSTAVYMCTDKNPDAASCCAETGVINNLKIEVLLTDLVEGLLPRVESCVDILLFNPPYVVTPSNELSQQGISLAWAGGINGREVMDRLFPLVPQLLSEKGIFYLVVVKENNPEEIAEMFNKLLFHSSVVMTRRSGPEFLSVMKFWRMTVMAGIADAIRLREFTNVHPQIAIEDVGTTKAPRTGHTVEGLYVCQVGRVHPPDPNKPPTVVRYNLSFPDISEIEPVEVGPWNPFETTYKLHYPSGLAPIDKRYTPTTHKAPLPVGAKSPPSLEALNPLYAHPQLDSNNSRDWNKISKKP